MSGIRELRPPKGGPAILYWLLVGCGGADGGDEPFAASYGPGPAGLGESSEGGDADDSDPQDDDGKADDSGSNDDGPSADAGDDGSETGGDESGGVEELAPYGACAEPVPAGSPTPPPAPSYSGGVCPTLSPGYITGFQSGGGSREFALAVPSNYDPSKQYPLVFGWHHLGGDAQGFLSQLGSMGIADATQTIYAIPNASGQFQFEWPSTPFDNGSADVDLKFFDDMLACISEQYNVNPYCVGSAGVSAGGLWTSYLGQKRGHYLSANVVISGGHPDDVGWWGWSSSPHKFASLVLWGGPSDELVISFHRASLNLVSEYRNDNHFVIACEHTGGHGAPPSDDGGDPPYGILVDFFLEHPYWLGDGESPYTATGLPEAFPDYCSL